MSYTTTFEDRRIETNRSPNTVASSRVVSTDDVSTDAASNHDVSIGAASSDRASNDPAEITEVAAGGAETFYSQDSGSTATHDCPNQPTLYNSTPTTTIASLLASSYHASIGMEGWSL